MPRCASGERPDVRERPQARLRRWAGRRLRRMRIEHDVQHEDPDPREDERAREADHEDVGPAAHHPELRIARETAITRQDLVAPGNLAHVGRRPTDIDAATLRTNSVHARCRKCITGTPRRLASRQRAAQRRRHGPALSSARRRGCIIARCRLQRFASKRLPDVAARDARRLVRGHVARGKRVRRSVRGWLRCLHPRGLQRRPCNSSSLLPRREIAMPNTASA
jgi:hypothetical protein